MSRYPMAHHMSKPPPPMDHKVIRRLPYTDADNTNIRATFQRATHGANSNKPVLDAPAVPAGKKEREKQGWSNAECF